MSRGSWRKHANDRVRFPTLRNNFDRVLNTINQPRSKVTGVAHAELFGK